MSKPDFLILCNGAQRPRASIPRGTKVVELDTQSSNNRVNLEIDDISRKFVRAIPDELADLLEIASYVYCADQATSRGGDAWRQNGERWNRNLKFTIPVRKPDLWNSGRVKGLLTDMLAFLSGDNYTFQFRKLTRRQPVQGYFHFTDREFEEQFEDVVLFSGGLDSLGGAIKEAIVDHRKVALVSHRSCNPMSSRQCRLRDLFYEKCDRDLLPYHVPVLVNKSASLTRDYTQRTRSFLYASLAATVSRILGLSSLKFYENGVVSFNLPISAQVIGTRATRSTHPKVLKDFEALFSELFDTSFKVQNPFIWKTKSDVVSDIASSGCADLIKHASSCSHPFLRTKLHTHCGTCSQCIDRRFAVLASNLEAYDPGEMYETDVLTGTLTRSDDITMVESYFRTMNEIEEMDEIHFATKYIEMSLATRFLEGSNDQAARQIYELYKRQSRQVVSVVEHAISVHSPKIRRREVPHNSLLGMVYAGRPDFEPDFEASDDYASVKWQGEVYEFTPSQAQVVGTLHEHHRRGTPCVSQHYLLEHADSRSARLRDLFKKSTAWGNLIVESEKKGNFRLNL